MFNRKLEPLSITAEFTKALDILCPTLDAEAFKWADCEALERRHNIGRGTLIVLDCIPEPQYKAEPLHERLAWLRTVLPTASWNPCLMPDDSVCVPPVVSDPAEDMRTHPIWEHLQTLNRHANTEFYEGLVGKRADSIYPIQLRGPDTEFPHWQKHRWQF